MNFQIKKIGKSGYAIIALVVLVPFFWLLVKGKDKESVSFVTEKVTITNIQNSITATGTIEPVTSITVGTQVSGIVSKLYVDYNSVVKKGQVIAELDKSNLTSQLNSAKAQLQQAKAQLQSAQSEAIKRACKAFVLQNNRWQATKRK